MKLYAAQLHFCGMKRTIVLFLLIWFYHWQRFVLYHVILASRLQELQNQLEKVKRYEVKIKSDQAFYHCVSECAFHLTPNLHKPGACCCKVKTPQDDVFSKQTSKKPTQKCIGSFFAGACGFQRSTFAHFLFKCPLTPEIAPDLVSQLTNHRQTGHVQGKGRGHQVKAKGHG